MVLPLAENDLAEAGIIEASMLHPKGTTLPSVAVLCYFNDVLTRLALEGELSPIYELRSEIGPNPIYQMDTAEGPVAVVHPGVGAPMAAWITEEMIALGATTLVACGSAGALEDLEVGHVMVVASALRDEGTSFHYAPASRILDADPLGVRVLDEFLTGEGVPHFVGRTWTTDAFMRETRGRIARRRDEGCSVVDMEASAYIAVTTFRHVRFAQFVYAGDTLAADDWDDRGWDRVHDVRESLYRLAVRGALLLHTASTP